MVNGMWHKVLQGQNRIHNLQSHLNGDVLVEVVESKEISNSAVRDSRVAESAHGLERVLYYLFGRRSLHISRGTIVQFWHILVVVCAVVLMRKSVTNRCINIADNGESGG